MTQTEQPQDLLDASLLTLEKELLSFKTAGERLQNADNNIKSTATAFEHTMHQSLLAMQQAIDNSNTIIDHSKALQEAAAPLIASLNAIDPAQLHATTTNLIASHDQLKQTLTKRLRFTIGICIFNTVTLLILIITHYIFAP